eukprot:symbB.v1.2.035695.t2/scaffold4868.1/size33687/1
MLEPPPQDMQEYMDSTESTGPDGITAVLVREIKRERVLLLRCVQAFQQRQQEADLRPVPTTLAEPLARLRSGQASGSDMMQARFREMVKISIRIPSLKRTATLQLKLNGWNTIVSVWDGLFSGAMLVSGSVFANLTQ